MSKNLFVFVVCGTREHIDTLHFSMRFLKKHSRSVILVLTDSTRNEVAIEHDNVIDVRTPKEFNHHQASIYLKTGIHKFVPKGNNYCYLDTDVIALSNHVDSIFAEFRSPIRFAPDHCTIDIFSPCAIDCKCIERRLAQIESLKLSMERNVKVEITDAETLEKAARLSALFEELEQSRRKKLTSTVRYHLSYPKFHLNGSFYFDRKQKTWHAADTHEIVMYEVKGTYIQRIESETGLKFDEASQKWLDREGIDIYSEGCNHLIDFIRKTFRQRITDKAWQHWNGGVFLFNDESHDFLESWHFKTMKIFKRKGWLTRDQGTLAATVWEFNLQDHPTLGKQWNFLADSNNILVSFDGKGGFTDNGWKDRYEVNLAHIYHRFGDRSWDLWNYVENSYANEH